MHLPKTVKDNSDELQSYIRSLKSWEEEAKVMDKTFNSSHSDATGVQETLPPLRNTPVIGCNNVSKTQNTTKSEKEKSSQGKPEKKKISGFDYAAWGKFDADSALHSDSDDNIESNRSKSSNLTRTPPSPQKDCDNVEFKRNMSNKLKTEGNKCYSIGVFRDAIAKYTQAMALDPDNHVIPANRAMAYIKTNEFYAAELDCSRSLKICPNYIKALLRRATSREHLKNMRGATEDYEEVLRLEPQNKDAKVALQKIRVKKQSEVKHSSANSAKTDAIHSNADNRDFSTLTSEVTSEQCSKERSKEKLMSTINNNECGIDASKLPDSLTSKKARISQRGIQSYSKPREERSDTMILDKSCVFRGSESVNNVSSDVVTPSERSSKQRSRKKLEKVKVSFIQTMEQLQTVMASASSINSCEDRFIFGEICSPTGASSEKLSETILSPASVFLKNEIQSPEPAQESTDNDTSKCSKLLSEEPSAVATSVDEGFIVTRGIPKESSLGHKDCLKLQEAGKHSLLEATPNNEDLSSLDGQLQSPHLCTGEENELTSKLQDNLNSLTSRVVTCSTEEADGAALQRVVDSKVQEDTKVISFEVPKTSVRFNADWQRIKNSSEDAALFLSSIPSKSFTNYELEYETLEGIIEFLAACKIPSERLHNCLSGLVRSKSFSRNLIFMEESVLVKLKTLIGKLEEEGLKCGWQGFPSGTS